MRLIKFGSKVCPACLAMARAKTIERFIERHPELTLVTLDCFDENGEAPKGSAYETNNEIAEAYEIKNLPMLIFETDDGGELNSWEGGIPMHELEKAYKQAKERYEAAQKVEAQVPATPRSGAV